jgi:hypothetical protein
LRSAGRREKEPITASRLRNHLLKTLPQTVSLKFLQVEFFFDVKKGVKLVSEELVDSLRFGFAISANEKRFRGICVSGPLGHRR